MGLKDEITADIADAFDTDLSDAVVSVTVSHYSRTQSDYDPSTGDVTRTFDSFTIRGVFYEEAKIEQIESGALPDMKNFLVLQSELALTTFPIEIGDRITYGTEIYTVYKIHEDPVNATFIYKLKGNS